jgi:hypothetical protein
MEGRFLLNGNSIAYLIHGQSFELQIKAIGCLFVMIHYEDGESRFWNWYIRSTATVFKSITNVYRPVIRVWGVGWGIKKLLHKELKINFINVKEQDIDIQFRPAFNLPQASVKNPDVRIGTSVIQISKVSMNSCHNHLELSEDSHDYEIYKSKSLNSQ